MEKENYFADIVNQVTGCALLSAYATRGAVGSRAIKTCGKKCTHMFKLKHYIVGIAFTLEEPRFPRQRVGGYGRREALQWVSRTILFRLLAIPAIDIHTSICS